MKRVLLVEFMAVDRFHRALEFPFVKGYLRSRGVEVRWLRLGLPARWRALRAEQDIDPDRQDRQRLVDVARQESTSHVLFNQQPSPGLVQSLGRLPLAPLIGVARNEAAGSRAGDDHRRQGQTVSLDIAGLDRFVGLEPWADLREKGAGNLFDATVPDFSWEAVNREADTAPALPFLVCGNECNYRRPLAGNTFFRGLDLSGCARADGCAFCLRPAGDGSWQNDAITLARRQLRALADTHPPCSGRLLVRALGAPIVANLESFAEAIRELRLPDSDFLLDARSDTLLAVRPRLERALKKLEDTRHRLVLALIGIESFVDRELDILNKGVDWRTNLAAVRALFELEHEYPAHFSFREHGGLSLLLFTPWTRPQDLALNLSIVHFCDLSDLCGKLFTSRLRLYPSLPLYPRAERDGLLRPGYDDRALDTARHTFYPDEVPWRFCHPVMEPVSRLLVRLDSERRDDSDPLCRALGDFEARQPRARDRLRLARALVDCAVADAELTEPVQLLNAAAACLETLHRPPPERTSLDQGSGAHEIDGPLHESLGLDLQLLAMQIGLKPVIRLEAAVADARRAGVSFEGLAPVTRLWKPSGAGEDRGPDIFLGQRPEEVEEAIRLTATMLNAAEEQQWRSAAERVGALLGYPACCVRTYARIPHFLRKSYTWARIMRRTEFAGEVPALFNPGCEIVDYLPCSLDCAESLRRAERLLEAYRARGTGSAARALEESMQNPWLMLANHEGQTVELRPEADPVGRFRYRAARCQGSHFLIERVRQGDEMVVDEQQMTVLRQGRVLAALGARAFIWWHRAAVQRDFWIELNRLRFGPKRADRTSAAGDLSLRDRHPVSGGLAAVASALLLRSGRQEVFAGYRVVSVEANHHERVTITLASGPDSLRVLVAPRDRAPHAYLLAGSLAFMHPRDEPLDTPAKQRALRHLARRLTEGAVGASVDRFAAACETEKPR